MADKNPIFYNRELSWLEFDKRCLSEAKDMEPFLCLRE